MTTEQALQILTIATANLPATRQQHQEIIQALQVLKTLCEDLTKKSHEKK